MGADVVPGRRILVAVGVVAGVVGLGMGWVLGGSSGPSEPSGAATASTAPEGSAPTSGADAPALEPIETVLPTTTSRPKRTTTTTLFPSPETKPVTLNPLLAGAEFRVVGLTSGSVTADIDVATAQLTTQRWGTLRLDAFATIIGDGWVVSFDQNNGGARLVTSDGEQSTPSLGDSWSLMHVKGTDLFWRGAESNPNSGQFDRFELVDINGEPTGSTIDTTGIWPYGVDPAGGVLTVVQGSTYSLNEDGVTIVGPGELLAASATTAVLRTCDELLECRLLIVNRSTGETRSMPTDFDGSAAQWYGWGPAPNTVSPDGSAMGMALPTATGSRLVVVDLESGVVDELTDRWTESGVSWSPDGRFAVFLDESTPMLYDRDTGSTEPLGEELGIWMTIEIRPTAA